MPDIRLHLLLSPQLKKPVIFTSLNATRVQLPLTLHWLNITCNKLTTNFKSPNQTILMIIYNYVPLNHLTLINLYNFGLKTKFNFMQLQFNFITSSKLEFLNLPASNSRMIRYSHLRNYTKNLMNTSLLATHCTLTKKNIVSSTTNSHHPIITLSYKWTQLVLLLWTCS